MKLTFALIALLALGIPEFSQDAQDVPTLAQCRTYKQMWAIRGRHNEEDSSSLTYEQMRLRAQTLVLCNSVVLNQHKEMTHEDYLESRPYADLSDAYVGQLLVRLHHYIARHGEMDQFTQEDAAGQR
jgi:hypothetical protein